MSVILRALLLLDQHYIHISNATRGLVCDMLIARIGKNEATVFKDIEWIHTTLICV